MKKSLLPVDSYEQLLSSYKKDHAAIEYDKEIHTILIYIGLLTVILLIVLIILSLINKCREIMNNEANSRARIQESQTRYKQYESNFFSNRQVKIPSVSSSSSSSSFLTNYHQHRIAPKPSLATTLQMLQYREKNFPSVVHI